MAGASELQKAVERLVAKEPGWQQVATKPTVGARPAVRSTGRPSSSGGAFEFDEKSFETREYWPVRQVASSDGIFTIELEPIKRIKLKSGDYATFAEPPPEE